MKLHFKFVLYSLGGVFSLFVAAAQLPDAPLKHSWYKTSIIIFTRPDISNENTAEMLFVDTSRSYPGNTLAFPFDPELSEYYNPQTPRPTLIEELPPLALGDFTSQQRTRPGLQERQDLSDAPTQPDNKEAPEPDKPSAMELALQAFVNYENDLKNDSLIPLPDGEHLMAQELKNLYRRDSYQVLYTETWTQAIPDRNNPAPILVQAGERRYGLFELEGVIAITLGRYLHVNADLWLHELSSRLDEAEQMKESGTAQNIKWMQISESRRMRSTELHYLDHPKFGVLIKIAPVEIPEPLKKLWQIAHAPRDLKEKGPKGKESTDRESMLR